MSNGSARKESQAGTLQQVRRSHRDIFSACMQSIVMPVQYTRTIRTRPSNPKPDSDTIDVVLRQCKNDPVGVLQTAKVLRITQIQYSVQNHERP